MANRYDTPCWNCDGSGEGNEGACSFCEGYGYQPTEEGDELLQFLKRRGYSDSPKVGENTTTKEEKDVVE